MAYSLKDLGRVFRNTMYDTLCGGDGSLPPGKDSFITWCMPGLPYTEQDFDFAANGLGTAKDAEGEKAMLQHAFNLAMQVDFVPDPAACYDNDKQQGVYRNDAGLRLSELYGKILRFSKVVNDELTPDQQAKLDKFRKLLRTTRTVKDIITDEEKQVTEDGPILAAYKQKQQQYIAAQLMYNNKRVAAQAASGPDGKAAVMDWSNNAPLYLMQAQAALGEWETGGYREDVDRINAYIQQVTQRSMLLWKQQLDTYYDDALVNATAAGERFYYTTVAPGDFASAPGWTTYKINHSMVDTTTHSESTSWSAGANVNFGFWSVGGGVQSNSSSYDSTYAVDEFTLSYDMTQVQIVRPWYYPEFFLNRGWTLKKGEGWMFDQMPSDGGQPPSGMFVGYPMQMVFVRNVTITSAAFKSAYHEYSNSVGANASVGWGPFCLSGSYNHSESGTHFHAEGDGASITVPGMQVICFINHLLGKTPNPLPELKDEDFT
jgi:hypothetical protein